MDEVLLRQLLRQIKILNFWIALLGTIMLIGTVIIGILLYTAMSFARDTASKVDTFQQETRDQLNFSDQLCSDDSLGELLRSQTEVCMQ